MYTCSWKVRRGRLAVVFTLVLSLQVCSRSLHTKSWMHPLPHTVLQTPYPNH